MVFVWPHTVEELAKFATIVFALVTFLSQVWQTSIRRKSEYNVTLGLWANGTLALLHRIKLEEPADKQNFNQDIASLELAIDQGRLFFPNKKVRGAEYGWRPRILDWLVYSVDLARIPDGVLSKKEKDCYLYKLRRCYIEDLQRILQPTFFSSTMMNLKIQLLCAAVRWMEARQWSQSQRCSNS
jgi:hypothetical protein